MTVKSDTKFEEKLICFKNDNNLVNFDSSTQNCGLENDMRNMANLHQST